jgi:hypothetical protein
VHNCFVGLFRGGFDARRGTLRTYLYAAIRNLSRKHSRDTGREDLTDEFEISSDDDDSLDVLLAREVAEELKNAVAALPLLQREVLVLAEYEELSLEEIAKSRRRGCGRGEIPSASRPHGTAKTPDSEHERNRVMDLRELLRQWETPPPSSSLDQRVHAAFRSSVRQRRNFWIPIAAAAAGVLVVGGLWMRRPIEIEMDSTVFSSATGVTAETQLNITGFQPIPNGKITVINKAVN